MESITCRTSTDALAPRRRRLVGGAGCCDRVALAFRGSCAGNRDPSSTIASIIVISPLTRLHSRDVPLKIACSLGDNINPIRLRRLQRPAAVQTPALPVISAAATRRPSPWTSTRGASFVDNPVAVQVYIIYNGGQSRFDYMRELSLLAAVPGHLPRNQIFVSRLSCTAIVLTGLMWQGNGPQAQPLSCVRRSTAHVSIKYLLEVPAIHPPCMSEGITQSLGRLDVLFMYTLQHTVSCEGVISIDAHSKCLSH
jgi:hypothetical protein